MKFAWSPVEDAPTTKERPETPIMFAVGSVLHPEGYAVTVVVNGVGCSVTPDGARLAAKQMIEWADHCDKRNVEVKERAERESEALAAAAEALGDKLKEALSRYEADAGQDKPETTDPDAAEADLLDKRREVANAKRRRRYAQKKRG